MKRFKVILVVIVALCSAGLAQADTVTFDFETLGRIYGASTGYAPGDPLFSEDGADLSIHEFYVGTLNLFNYAQIDPPLGPPFDFGDVQILELNNVTALFEFSGPGNAVLDYIDLGGEVNLEVNGAGLLQGADMANLAGPVAPGVTLSVSTVFVAGGVKGVASFSGPVETLRIGGQEFWIDSVACNNDGSGGCLVGVDHQTLAVGASWGSALGTLPGDLMFVESGVPVRAALFDHGNGTILNLARIEAPGIAGFGFDRAMNLNNFSNVYGIGALGSPVSRVTFEYVDYGGTENLQVNGATLFRGDLHNMPAVVAPGVSMNVATTVIPGGIRGEVTLAGDVQELLLGGQEFLVDNVCVYPDEGGCDLFSGNESLPAGTLWGATYGQTPGDLAFNENGIDARLHEFDWGTGTAFNRAFIGSPWGPAGTGQVLDLNNICMGYELAPFAPVDWVSFDFCKGGGFENLEIAGTRYIGDIASIPAGFFPGFTVNVVATPGPGYLWGTVTIFGPVEGLIVGGQEFYMDDLCVMRYDPSGVPRAAERGVVLEPNVPNPFNPSTTVRFRLERDGHARMTVHDLAGRRVATLVDGPTTAGDHEAVWSGRGDDGRGVSAGMYLLLLESGGSRTSRKITLVK